jgi:hypothetical protein
MSYNEVYTPKGLYPKDWTKEDIELHLQMYNLNNNIYAYNLVQQSMNEIKVEEDDEVKESPKLIRESSSIFIEHKN